MLAKGETFNEAKWRKILGSLDYSEILDQMHEWDAEAKLLFKPGKQVSDHWEGISGGRDSVNPQDYAF